MLMRSFREVYQVFTGQTASAGTKIDFPVDLPAANASYSRGDEEPRSRRIRRYRSVRSNPAKINGWTVRAW